MNKKKKTGKFQGSKKTPKVEVWSELDNVDRYAQSYPANLHKKGNKKQSMQTIQRHINAWVKDTKYLN